MHAFLQVFVRAVHEANWLNGMELSIYDSWFDPVLSSLPGLIPDGFILSLMDLSILELPLILVTRE